MAGSARSLGISMFAGLRVAKVVYYPAHSKNGKNISQKAVVTAYSNIASKANNGEGHRDILQFTAWGKLADTMARSCSRGKELNIIGELRSYKGRVFQQDAQGNPAPVLGNDGQPIMTTKYSWTIMKLTFGEDSAKQIMAELQANQRPANWNTPGHPDFEAWKNALKARQSIQFNPQASTFGFAAVGKVDGPGVGAYQQDSNSAPQTAAPDNTNTPAPAAVQATFTPPTAPAQPAAAVNEGGFVVPGV